MPYKHTRYKENIHTSIFVYTYSTYTHMWWITMVWGFSVQVRSFSWMWDSAIPRHSCKEDLCCPWFAWYKTLIGWFAGDWWQYLANRARDLGWCQWWHIEIFFVECCHSNQAGFFRCLCHFSRTSRLSEFSYAVIWPNDFPSRPFRLDEERSCSCIHWMRKERKIFYRCRWEH